MKTITTLLFLVLISTLITCTQSSDSNEPVQITISGVWFTKQLDNDGDGYYCDAELHFALTASKPNVNFFIELGIRPGSDYTGDPYEFCFRSVNILIGDDKTGEWYVSLYTIDAAISEGYYDFQLKVFLTTNTTDPVDIATLTTNPDLGNFPLEEVSNDPVEEWMSWIDNDTFESSFTYYPRMPVGVIYTTLAEKFEKPSNSDIFHIEKVRVHIPTVYTSLPQMTIALYDQLNNLPNAVLSQVNYNINTEGWNEFDLEYDLSLQNIFYIGVNTSINYAVSIDTNSVMENGFVRRYSSANPPSDTWIPQQQNYGIEIFVSYTLSMTLVVIEPAIRFQSAEHQLRPGIPLK